jgi:hypothetical protein
MLTILAMFVIGAAEVQNLRDLLYNERFDLTSFSRSKRVFGTVQSVSRLRIAVQTDGKIPELKSYPTHRRLSQGLCSYRAIDAIAYATSDIRIGDIVGLYIYQEDKTDYCYAISPSRRPGGLVPESRHPNFFRNYAEDANATNAFNDTGRPIPRHLQAGVRAAEYLYTPSQIHSYPRISGSSASP